MRATFSFLAVLGALAGCASVRAQLNVTPTASVTPSADVVWSPPPVDERAAERRTNANALVKRYHDASHSALRYGTFQEFGKSVEALLTESRSIHDAGGLAEDFFVRWERLLSTALESSPSPANLEPILRLEGELAALDLMADRSGHPRVPTGGGEAQICAGASRR